MLALDSYERLRAARHVAAPRVPSRAAGHRADGDRRARRPGAVADEPRLGGPGAGAAARAAPPVRVDRAAARRRGLTSSQAARANRLRARAPPRARARRRGAPARTRTATSRAGPPPAVIRQLLDALLAGLPDRTIETLEAASTSRRVTEPVLRVAARPPGGARATSTPSRGLPFVERTARGADDPRRGPRGPRRRPARARPGAARAPTAAVPGRTSRPGRAPPTPERLWSVTADLIYLIQNPVLRAACFPVGSAGHRSSPPPGRRARDPRDRRPPRAARRRRAARRAGSGRARGLLGRPRARTGRSPPSLHLAEIGDLDPALLDGDPVARAWRGPPGRRAAARRRPGADHAPLAGPRLGRDAVPGRRRVLARREARLHGAAAASVAALFGDGRSRTPWRRSSTPLGFAPVGAPVDVGGGVLTSRSGSTSAREAWTAGCDASSAAEIDGEEAAAAGWPTAPPVPGSPRARSRCSG